MLKVNNLIGELFKPLGQRKLLILVDPLGKMLYILLVDTARVLWVIVDKSGFLVSPGNLAECVKEQLDLLDEAEGV